jgi:hypothetical protein
VFDEIRIIESPSQFVENNSRSGNATLTDIFIFADLYNVWRAEPTDEKGN